MSVKRRYRTVGADRLPGVRCVDTTVTALGVTRRAVLTHSATLHAAQSRGFDQTLAKASQRRLGDLADRLARGETRKPRDAVQAEIFAICKARWVNEVITTTIIGTNPAELRLSYAISPTGRAALEDRIFGKRILFINRDDWPTADVVAAYTAPSPKWRPDSGR